MRNYLSTTALALSLSAGALVSLSANSASVVLDFSGNICGAAGNQACTNFAQIGQNYGDTTGLNVSHRSTDLAGATYEPFLKYWANNYSGLNDIAWGGAGETGQRSEFTFAALSGYTVSVQVQDSASTTLGSPALSASSGQVVRVDVTVSHQALRAPVVTNSRRSGNRSSSERGNGVRSRIATTTSKPRSRSANLASASSARAFTRTANAPSMPRRPIFLASFIGFS